MKMKIVALLLGFSVLLFIACKKDKFTTEPQLKYKSISPSSVIKGNIINLNVSFTDDEGDIQDSVLLTYKRYNSSGGILTLDTIRVKMDPEGIPVARDGELNVKFSYGEIYTGSLYLPLETVDREVSFGLIIRDKAEHRSNYVESDKVTLKKL